MMNEIIEPTVMPDATGLLWYLDGINEGRLMYLSGLITQAERAFGVGRIKSPTVRICPESEAQMRRQTSSGEWECHRLVSDLWLDGIDIAAHQLLESYKQFPYALSAEDAIYYWDGKVMRSDYVWTVAVYGGDVSMLATTAEKVGWAINIRNEVSPRVKVRGKDNEDFSPNVAIMDVTMIDGGIINLPSQSPADLAQTPPAGPWPV